MTTTFTVVTVDGEARGEGTGSGERGYVTSRGHVAWPLSESRVGPSGSRRYRSESDGWRHRRGWRGTVAAGRGRRRGGAGRAASESERGGCGRRCRVGWNDGMEESG